MTQSRAGRSSDAQVAPRLDSIDEVQSLLAAQRYIADRGLATAVFLALKRHKPLLLEGEPGVGKTEIARALATFIFGSAQLPCSEGIDQSMAVYEWNYARQLLYIRSLEATKAGRAGAATCSGRSSSSAAPCSGLDVSSQRAPVLLIDELDRADAEFEAYLLGCSTTIRSPFQRSARSAPRNHPSSS
jgi:MoxR-like ATPase